MREATDLRLVSTHVLNRSQQSWPTNGSQAPAGEKSVPTTGPPPGLSSPTESALRSSVVHRPAAPSRSLADEWLNGALRQSLSLSSPPPPPTREVGEYRSDYQPQHNHAVFSVSPRFSCRFYHLFAQVFRVGAVA